MFFNCSLKNHPQSWAATFQQMTNTLSLDPATRKPHYTKSSFKIQGSSCVEKNTDFLKVFCFFWENKSILFFRNIRMAEKPEKWQNQVGILRNPEQNLQSNRTMCIYLWNDWEMTAAKISCHLGLCLSRIDYHVKRNGYLVHNYNYQRFGWEKKGIMNSCCLGRRACLIKPTIWGCVYQTFADCEKKNW